MNEQQQTLFQFMSQQADKLGMQTLAAHRPYIYIAVYSCINWPAYRYLYHPQKEFVGPGFGHCRHIANHTRV
jgi:hypothetical protein